MDSTEKGLMAASGNIGKESFEALNCNREEAFAEIGFEVCEFGPDTDDFCEKCGRSDVQLYARGCDHMGRDCEYYCSFCIEKEIVAVGKMTDAMVSDIIKFQHGISAKAKGRYNG